jgi:transcriptional regulator with XRE-family HTH domain
MATTTIDKKEINWTPRLIKRLRGNRSFQQFAALLGTTANTVWRWEDARTTPAEHYQQKLSDLASNEHFFSNWKLVGSIELVENFELVHKEFRQRVKSTLNKRAKELLD